MSGGAGYILSRGALNAFEQAGARNKTLLKSQGAEDVQMGNLINFLSLFLQLSRVISAYIRILNFYYCRNVAAEKKSSNEHIHIASVWK